MSCKFEPGGQFLSSRMDSESFVYSWHASPGWDVEQCSSSIIKQTKYVGTFCYLMYVMCVCFSFQRLKKGGSALSRRF